jgi:tRNA threonylcarbamoyl adenosine modification protein (Sua5/YciO/YrdC/YwlC family)
LPTETVYGIAVLPLEGPLASVIAVKDRAPEKGIAVLIDEPAQVSELVEMPPAAARLAERFWPGALTLVLDVRPDVALPSVLTGGTRRLGVRLPDHPVPRAIARVLGPIAVTSANRSGEPEALDAASLRDQLGGSIALIIDGGPVPGSGTPSAVVSVDVDGGLSILRAGAIPAERLLAVANGRVR